MDKFLSIQNLDLVKDIKKLGLEVISDGWENDSVAAYLQIGDSSHVLLKAPYDICHYEILKINRTTNKLNHVKDKIYVEIHFEDKAYGSFLKPIVRQIAENNNELETFNWRKECPGLRIKGSCFEITDKDKILKDLSHLKDLTLDVLLKTIKEYPETDNLNFCFRYKSNNKKTVQKMNKKKHVIEAGEIDILHEAIKFKLIEQLEKDKCVKFLDKTLEILSVSPENSVNKNNYIDLVAKKLSGKYIFFEIKTSPDPRLCIRQALGQLMEYSHFPNKDYAEELIVVGMGEKTPVIENYINKLNTYEINIDYLQIPL